MNRKLLKDNAKIALKQNFWLVMLVVLVAQFLGVSDVGATYGGGGGGSSSSSFFEDLQQELEKQESDDISLYENGLQTMSVESDTMQLTQMSTEDGVVAAVAAMSIGIMLFVIVIVLVISFAITAFLTNPIQVGYRRFFMLNRGNQAKFADLFSAFCPQYMNIVKGMFTTNLIIFGWTMLFIIPGIIKSYQYFFVPFLLCENPTMSGARAREISKQMTDGYKFKIFVLALSFLGWELLAALLAIPAALLTCCFLGIGAMLVYVPIGGYVSATYAELYEERREFALYTNIASSQELCGFQQEAQS